MSESSWGLARRIAFRFGIISGVLLLYPFPFELLPSKVDWIATYVRAPWDWAIVWFAQHVLGLSERPLWDGGSGDTTWNYVQLLLIVIAASLGTTVWSVLDRRRKAYPRLAAAAHVVLRYVLAAYMLYYGISKILRQQFSDLSPANLESRFGDMSPMGLAWRFMKYSTPYTVFSGACEALGGALLLWPRTATLGALVLIPVMTNVVMFNLCYDVCVKLFSMQLLAMAILIALPGVRRVLAAVLGYPTAEAPQRPRMSARSERVSRIAKLVTLAYFAITMYMTFSSRPDYSAHGHELHGSWAVDSFTADGVEVPPLITQKERWRTCSLGATQLTTWALDGTATWFGLEVDAGARTLKVKRFKNPDAETWNYTRPTPDQLEIDGVHDGKQLHVTLHRKPYPLLARGFRWISETPFNR